MADESKPRRRAFGAKVVGVIGKAAPALSDALSGPLAAAATEALSRALLGRDDGDAGAIEAAVLRSSGSDLAAIERADRDFREALLAASLDEQRVHAGDRADARARQLALKDATPTYLGMGVIAGFFFVLAVMLWRDLPAETETEFSIMLGALATMTAAVVNYFFGSSVGSREKTQLMAETRHPSRF